MAKSTIKSTSRSAADAVPVGALARKQPCSARRIERTASGAIVFGGEEPISVAVNLRMVELSTGRTRTYWRVEAKMKTPRPHGRPGDTLVVTEAPYGNRWSATATFKRGSKHARKERLRVAADTLEEAQRLVEAEANDPWETGEELTAGITVPTAVHNPLRSYGWSAKWVFGICADFLALRDELAESEDARRLVVNARVHGLRIVRPSAHGAPVVFRLPRNAGAGAGEVMLLSISQALAGPDDAIATGDRARRAEPDDWVGQPVMKLAERIYRDHMYNRARARLRQRQQEAAYRQRMCRSHAEPQHARLVP